MQLTICGPNLPGNMATFVVHRAGCRDLDRYPLNRATRSTEEHETVRSVVESFYGPEAGSFYEEHFGDDIPENAWEDYADEFHFAPCVVGLPYE
jgi:hypothetical protein